MKAEVINLMLMSAVPTVKITHGKEELAFLASCFGRNNFRNFDMFEQINLYWEGLEESKQQQIFNIYRSISRVFSEVWDRSDLATLLTEEVAKLLDMHDFDAMYHWVVFRSPIILPDSSHPTIKSEYVYSIDKQDSRERTYTKPDYTKLVTLSLILRTMIPVWGEYISNTRVENGTLLKEFYAHQIISRSKLMQSDAYEKLRVYIDHTVGEDRNNPSTIAEGISSEDFLAWMLGLVSIRRLCVGDIRGLDPRANLITFIHKFVVHRMKGTDITAENIIKEKTIDDGGSEASDKLSTLERYKIKHDISLGEIVELEHIMKDPIALAHQLSSNMTDELIMRCLASAKKLEGRRLLDPQITLLCWIVKPVISPRAIMYLAKSTLVRHAFPLMQAVLWARGHQYLSLLSTSYANIVEGELHVSSVDSRAKITKEMVAELDKLYPYQRVTGGKKTGQKFINPAIKSIETLADNLAMFSWSMTADDKFIAEVFNNNNTRRIPIAYDIKLHLAKLVIEIGARSWV